MATRVRRIVTVPRGSYLEWSAIIAGAIGAAAISFLLLTFGAAIGLTLTSPWPHEGVSVWGTVLAVGWWAVLVQIGSFFVGGYLAGRMRAGWGDAALVEGQFRDGAHGFMVWAVGVLMGAFLLALTGGSALKTAVQSTATVAAGTASGNTGTAGSTLATGPVDYAVDSLYRPAPRAAPGGGAGAVPNQPNNNNPALRDEARRIFTGAIANREFTARDRDYLTDTVASRTGLSNADAQRRVDQSLEEARTMEIKSRTTADKARKAGLIAGFLTAASLLISLAAAAAGARLGGRHRDEGTTANFFGARVW